LKRTSDVTFPIPLIIDQVIPSLDSSNFHMRDLSKSITLGMYRIFGFKKLEKLFQNAPPNRLEMFAKDIPEVSLYIKISDKDDRSVIPKKDSKPTGKKNDPSC
jgi:hypothetical protein